MSATRLVFLSFNELSTHSSAWSGVSTTCSGSKVEPSPRAAKATRFCLRTDRTKPVTCTSSTADEEVLFPLSKRALMFRACGVTRPVERLRTATRFKEVSRRKTAGFTDNRCSMSRRGLTDKDRSSTGGGHALWQVSRLQQSPTWTRTGTCLSA